MCKLCKQTPCASRCPNTSTASDADASRCSVCGRVIGFLEGYCKIFDFKVCEDCIEDSREVEML